MNLQASTLKFDERGEPSTSSRPRRYTPFRGAGHPRTPRASVSRSIFALTNDRWAYFGKDAQEQDEIGYIDNARAVFCRGYAAEPDVLVEQLRKDDGDRRSRHTPPDRP